MTEQNGVPLLSDDALESLFEAAGLSVPEPLKREVWAAARDLKLAAELLRSPPALALAPAFPATIRD